MRGVGHCLNRPKTVRAERSRSFLPSGAAAPCFALAQQRASTSLSPNGG
ncbi:hypothetical protein SFOMI_2807 [Sphingobium fuliginis]|uniref:Uncharacterized protein n=1 Tax=Sphingobium fuliginis (strain ATCC 27551) TaxID=336203 RepID=A0A292ZH53_SPHSA|nr:hypothetical protein SFOMI_2807 [Sphingobium fuliginis]